MDKVNKIDLKEEAVHGTVKFPLAVYRYAGEGDFTVKLHWHEETEIIYLKKGRFCIDINMQKYRINSPDRKSVV